MKNKTPLAAHLNKKNFRIDITFVAALWVFAFYSFKDLQSLFKVAAIVATLETIAFVSSHIFKRNGLIIQGFVGGMVSSTAIFIKFTHSKHSGTPHSTALTLGLISATIAMLLECAIILLSFIGKSQISLLYPVLIQLVFLFAFAAFLKFSKPEHANLDEDGELVEISRPVMWKNVVKLTAIILALIHGLRFLNAHLDLGANVAIFIMSFFEAHGVLAASLLSNQGNSTTLLQILLILSGHTFSKTLLLFRLKNKTVIKTVALALYISLFLSWGVYLFFNRF